MEFVSKAYREGQRSGKYSSNPYCEGSKEYDEFERGATQTIRLSKEAPFGTAGAFYGDPDDDVRGSVPFKKTLNKYALARKK